MIPWLTAHNVTHPLISGVAFLAIALGTGSVVLAATVPLVFYYSRELAHAEKKANDTMRPWRYVLPWTWGRSEQLDWWPVVAVVAVLTVIWSRFP